jgi:hypothetical protein
LGLELHDFSCFPFFRLIMISYPESRISRINLCWLNCFYLIFFSFSFHHFFLLRVELYCFILFILYWFISISGPNHGFGMLTPAMFFCPLLKSVHHSTFDLL